MARLKLSELEAQASPKKPENIGEYIKQKAPFTTGTLPAVARGAANKVRQTTSQPILRFLANAGLPSARKEIEQIDRFNQENTPSTAEKVGGTIADVAMLASPTPMGKGGILARGAAAGVQGAAQHQAQNYARTGEMSPGDASAEAALTAATMGAGSKLGPLLKKMGVKTLAGLTRAPKSIMKGVNKPTDAGYAQALENRLVPIAKGGFGEAEKRGIALQVARDKLRSDMLAAEGVKVNLPGAIREAEQDILGRVTGSSGLLPSQKAQAIGHLDDYRLAAKAAGANRGGFVSGADAIGQRKLADQNARFIENKTPAGLDLASQSYREAIEDQLMRRMAGKSSEGAYKANKAEMAELAPVLEAFGDKAISNYSYAPELISGTVGGVAGMGTGSIGLGLLPLALTASRRYPGTAPILYEAGRGASSKAARKGGKAMLDLSRSQMFGGEE